MLQVSKVLSRGFPFTHTRHHRRDRLDCAGTGSQSDCGYHRASMAESVEQPFRDHLQRARDTLEYCCIKDDQIEERLELCKEGIANNYGIP